MSEETTGAVGRFFDGYAADFDAIYGHTHRRSAFGRWVDRRFRGVMVRRFEETLRRTATEAIQSIVDVGCGSGRYVAAFARQGKTVTGVDLAEGMLALAREATSEAVTTGQVRYVQGDYLKAKFETSFDAACLMGFFDYIADPVAVLQKLGREVDQLIVASFPISGGWLAAQRKVRYRLRGCPLWLYTRSDVEDILGKAGFGGRYEIVDLERDWFVAVDLRGIEK